MTTDLKKISNPLTIIAIFAALAEINGTVVLGLVPTSLQSIFLWFIILFPSVLVLIFFFTLNFNPKVLYAPSDFSNEDNFLKTLGPSLKKFDPISMEVTTNKNKHIESITNIVRKKEGEYFNKSPFLPETYKHLQLANSFYKHFHFLYNNKFEKGVIEELRFGIEAPEYFLISYSIYREILKQRGSKFSESIIIRVTEDESREIALIAIGKNIIEKDPEIFASKIIQYIDHKISKVVDFEKLKNNLHKCN